jgi:hypothetical protein
MTLLNDLHQAATDYINLYADEYNYTKAVRDAHLAPVKTSTLGMMKRMVKTKMGVVAAKGDFVLIHAEKRDEDFVTIWSFRNKCWTSIKTKDVTVY